MTQDYDWVSKALEYLGENFREQPDLEELSRHLGVSPFHLQRVFKRWVGISPKRFLQYLTLDHARRMLAESRSVLDTAFESGLSGPGRLHDLFVTLEAVTPGEFKTGGEGLHVRFGLHDSPFGMCLLGTTERGVCWLSFQDGDDPGLRLPEIRERWPGARLEKDQASTRALAGRIFSARSRSGGSRIPLVVEGTNFQIKVWEALLRIPEGCVVAYGDLARRIGSPGAGRAVGNAVAANPIGYLIPCHRVIRGMGTFGRYGSGRTRKRALLGWEAARRPT
jgi:AraC family transcriptional regulator of adaptative response/methylated-DNA-[protein]-cysteine methyltransferase